MYKNKLKLLLILISLMGFVQTISAQSAGDYRSVASGNWKDLTVWQIFTASGWRTPTALEGYPNSSAGVVAIGTKTNVVFSDTIEIDQLQVLAGASLTVTSNAHMTVNFTNGYDLAVYGTLELAGNVNLIGKTAFYAGSNFKCNLPSWTFSNAVVSHPNALLEFGLGGEVKLQYQVSVATGRISVKNKTHLKVSAANDPVSLMLPNGSNTDLFVESGSTFSILSSIKSFTALKSSSLEINGVLANFSILDLSADLTKCTISGKLVNHGEIPGAIASRLVFNDNSIYDHAIDSGSIPLANWSPLSTITLSGVTSTFPKGFNQSIGNLTLGSSLSKDIAIATSIDINGSLTISTPADKKILLNNSDSIHHTIFVGKDFILESGNVILTNSSGSGSLQIGGNFYQDGGNLYLKSASGNAVVFVEGNTLKNSGMIFFRSTDSSSASGDSWFFVKKDFQHISGTINFAPLAGISEFKIAGNFTNAGGLITETGTGKGIITFNGHDVQVFESTSVISNTVDFVIDSASFVQMATANTRATGAGTFTVEAGAGIGIRATAGAMLAPATTGNINTLNRIFKSGAHFVFNGTTNQNLGNAFSVCNPASLTIDNPGIVYQNTDLIVSGDVKINQGEFSTRNYHLKLGGNWINNGKYNPGTVSQITFNGSKQQIISGNTVTAFLTLLLDNIQGLLLTQDLQINTQLFLVNGNLTANDHAIILGINAKSIAGAPFSSSKMIVLNEQGTVKKLANSALQASYYFPIGNINGGKKLYSPIQLQFAGGTYAGFYSVKVIDTKHPQNPDPVNYLTRFWTVHQEGFKLFNASLRAEFDSSDVNGSRDVLRLSKYNETNVIPWTNFPVAASGNSFYVTGITSFSDFTGLGNSTATKTTARSISNMSAGTTATNNRNIKSGPPVMSVYPNPVTGRNLQLAFNNFSAGKYEMIITNNLGQRVLAESVQHNGGNMVRKILMPSGSKGVYRIQLNGEGENLVSSFIIE